MIYRVILKISYYEAWFDFDNVEEAAGFVAIAMAHQVENEDTQKKKSVRIEVIDPTFTEEASDES